MSHVLEVPDARGHFGIYGGRFMPETAMPALEELDAAYRAHGRRGTKFWDEFEALLRDFAGRPTPLYYAERLSKRIGKDVKIYLKREDMAHTGAHKINNTLGQVLLALKMGKQRVIAETGAGQHGVATATAAARLGLPCEVYMGEEDIARQRLNVFRMELLGSKVNCVCSGSKTLKDAINEAIRDWATNIRTTHYVIGSVIGPHPYPAMVRDFQSVIGDETRRQILAAEGQLPNYILACVGGGSNAMGIFHPFKDDASVKKIGVEAGGFGITTGKHGATLSAGTPGVLHGCMSYLLQDKDGQILPTHSVSAGLDYPGVGPEHSFFKDTGIAEYSNITDDEALQAFHALSELEGIIPALESAHAVAYLYKLKDRLKGGEIIVVNLSGRGDKDVQQISEFEAKRD